MSDLIDHRDYVEMAVEKYVTKNRQPGTPIHRSMPIDGAQLEYAASVTKHKHLSQDQWCALLDWLDWLQTETSKRTADEMRALLATISGANHQEPAP